MNGATALNLLNTGDKSEALTQTNIESTFAKCEEKKLVQATGIENVSNAIRDKKMNPIELLRLHASDEAINDTQKDSNDWYEILDLYLEEFNTKESEHSEVRNTMKTYFRILKEESIKNKDFGIIINFLDGYLKGDIKKIEVINKCEGKAEEYSYAADYLKNMSPINNGNPEADFNLKDKNYVTIGEAYDKNKQATNNLINEARTLTQKNGIPKSFKSI